MARGVGRGGGGGGGGDVGWSGGAGQLCWEGCCNRSYDAFDGGVKLGQLDPGSIVTGPALLSKLCNTNTLLIHGRTYDLKVQHS